MYQQQAGLLYVLGFVATRDQPVELSITVPAGVATDAAGAANAAASATLAYQPASSSLGWLGTAGSAAFGGTMALSFATGILGGGEAGQGGGGSMLDGSAQCLACCDVGGNNCLLSLLQAAWAWAYSALPTLCRRSTTAATCH